jgi:hypothetical protein
MNKKHHQYTLKKYKKCRRVAEAAGVSDMTIRRILKEREEHEVQHTLRFERQARSILSLSEYVKQTTLINVLLSTPPTISMHRKELFLQLLNCRKTQKEH